MQIISDVCKVMFNTGGLIDHRNFLYKLQNKTVKNSPGRYSSERSALHLQITKQSKFIKTHLS